MLPLSSWCVLWLSIRLHVVVRYCALLGILLCHSLVCWVGCDGDDVPGVEEAGKICETWEEVRNVLGNGVRE